MKRLYDYIQRFAVISEAEFEQLAGLLELRHYDKKQILVNFGEIENFLFFVDQGLIRKYFMRDKEEINTQLAREGDIICSSVSFLSQAPSEYAVEALEPCRLFALSFENLQKVYSMGYNMDKLGRLIVLDWLLQKEIWEHNRIKNPPRERFVQFIRENSDLVQRVPQKYLASYLNMKPETFSRYKHLLK
ncbi:MAG: cyclic nucleotide-binding domain-containing protein [Gemmatimonadaceae bacterium]|nr:cyclic nucleotide-binding domain-containing protein [Chitinophagaceae bacterium]